MSVATRREGTSRLLWWILVTVTSVALGVSGYTAATAVGRIDAQDKLDAQQGERLSVVETHTKDIDHRLERIESTSNTILKEVLEMKKEQKNGNN